MVKHVSDIVIFISPNVKSYSNKFTGVIQVEDSTSTSDDVELTKVRFKLPGNGEWAVGYVNSEDLED